MCALLDLCEHLERAENGQAGANERKKLLVEDEEGLELDLSPRHAAQARARLHGEDVIARMGEARTQLLGGGGGLDLLHDATAFIG